MLKLLLLVLVLVLVAHLPSVETAHPVCERDPSLCHCNKNRPCFARGLAYCDQCPLTTCPRTHCCCRTKVDTCERRSICQCSTAPCDVMSGRYCNPNNMRNCRQCQETPEYCCCDVPDIPDIPDIPDDQAPCTKTCSYPLQLADDCSGCNCPVELSSGRTYQRNGAPVASANLTIGDSTLAMSGEDGSFSICAPPGDEIMAVKKGYGNVTVRAGEGAFIDIMLPIGFIYITVSPFSQLRMLGESVTFCCAAQGLPNAVSYSWFKMVDTPFPMMMIAGTGQQLIIPMISFSDSGQYICVAHNNVGYALSSEASLSIFPPWHVSCPTCTRAVSLQEGCMWNGLSYYMVARCRRRCRLTNNRDIACSPTASYRSFCVPDYRTIQIQCPAGVRSLSIPWRCSCRRVYVNPPHVFGHVYRRGARPRGMGGVAVYINDESVGRTNDDGFYNITLLTLSSRYAIKFEPAMPFTPVTKVVNTQEDYDGGIRLDVILPEAKPITIDASQDSKVSIPLLEDDEDVTMIIPSGALLDMNYEAVEGEAIVWITTFRTDSRDAAGEVPSDFTTLANNTAMGLMTEGVFSMAFTDERRRPLFVKKSCKLSINAARLSMTDQVPPPLIWGLDDNTGLWEVNTELRTGEGGRRLEGRIKVEPDISTYNIDYMFDLCMIKVRVYRNAEFNEDDQLAGVQVSVVTNVGDSTRWSFVNTATTNEDGVCLPVACCTSARCQRVRIYARIMATNAAMESQIPADPNLGQVTGLSPLLLTSLEYDAVDEEHIHSRISPHTSGPTHTSRARCDASTGYHFRFYQDHDESTINNAL